MNASWAACCNHEREFALFPGMEPERIDICATLLKILHVSGGSAAKVLWTMGIRAVTFSITPA
jgi:hypothetical protein